MDPAKIMLLVQLVNQLNENSNSFEKAYIKQDKESFDESKKNILDLQKKISLVLKK